MRNMLAFGTLMVGVLLVLPDRAQSQNKDQNRKSNVAPATPDDYKTLLKNKEVTGIVVSADAKTLTFRLDSPHVQPNTGKGRPGTRVVHGYKEFDLDVAEKVVVKKMYIKADYDDKGNFKVDEAAQKELRSKGYIASTISDIKSGNVAKIVVTAPKKEDKEEGVGNVAKPVVKTIYLVQEGNPIEPSKGPEKKKKG